MFFVLYSSIAAFVGLEVGFRQSLLFRLMNFFMHSEYAVYSFCQGLALPIGREGSGKFAGAFRAVGLRGWLLFVWSGAGAWARLFEAAKVADPGGPQSRRNNEVHSDPHDKKNDSSRRRWVFPAFSHRRREARLSLHYCGMTDRRLEHGTKNFGAHCQHWWTSGESVASMRPSIRPA